MRFAGSTGLTLGTRLDETKGKTTGFDYLRIGLSLSVIVFHSFMTSYGPGANRPLESGWSRPAITFILPAFFALSGFLVAGSLLRSKNLWEFITLRALRLVPALFFEVLISAMLIGPLLTSFSLQNYFGDPLFQVYWLNILGEIHYRLPGLFLANPDPDIVNRQLWTIPVELKCYAALSVLFLLGASKHKSRMLIITGLCFAAFPLYDFVQGLDLDRFNNVPVKVLIESFLSGVLIFLFKEKIPLNRIYFIFSIFLSYVLLLGKLTSYLAPIPIAYATIFLGLCNTKENALSRAGQYSYGLYIYGYVIQQTYASLFPDFHLWWMNIICTVPAAFIIAFLSWRLVEKPALDRRKSAVAFVERMVSAFRIFCAYPFKGPKTSAPSIET